MAIINFVNTKCTQPSALNRIISYVTKSEKTEEKLVSGKDVMPECAYEEMMLTKRNYHKTTGRQYLHLIQSFSPDENVDHKMANEIALKLAEQFKDFQVLVTTHKDKEHIHSHLIINSVNTKTGLKVQQSFKDLVKLMDTSDKICKSYGLSVVENRDFGKKISKNEYHVAMKGESWKLKLINQIDISLKKSTSKKEFIECMNSHGYEVLWQDSRKYIAYTTPDGKRCRANKLHDKKYTKEEMENVFNTKQNEKRKSGTGRRVYLHPTTDYDNTPRTMESYGRPIFKGNHTKARQHTRFHQREPAEVQGHYNSFTERLEGRKPKGTDARNKHDNSTSTKSFKEHSNIDRRDEEITKDIRSREIRDENFSRD